MILKKKDYKKKVEEIIDKVKQCEIIIEDEE